MKISEEYFPRLGEYVDLKMNDGSINENVMYDEDDNGGFFTSCCGDINIDNVDFIRPA